METLHPCPRSEVGAKPEHPSEGAGREGLEGLFPTNPYPFSSPPPPMHARYSHIHYLLIALGPLQQCNSSEREKSTLKQHSNVGLPIFLLRLIFIILHYMYVYVSGYMHMCGDAHMSASSLRGQRCHLPLEMSWEPLTWMLGTELWSSGIAASTPNH